MIDVGAERGGFAEEMLLAGVTQVHAFEPNSQNAQALRRSFEADRRVNVHDCALSDHDGDAELNISVDPSDGTPVSFGHTLLERPDTDEIAWRDSVKVKLRSLESLLSAGALPRQVGILKVDTEGHDLEVIQGMGPLEAEVIMVEHWTDLPHGLGQCPWTIDELLAVLRPRGFSHFAFVVHRADFVTLKWDDAEVETGCMGNLVFLRDDRLTAMMPEVLECAAWLSEGAVRVGRSYMHTAHERELLIDELKHAVDEMERAANERLALIEELHEVAAVRLRALEEASRGQPGR